MPKVVRGSKQEQMIVVAHRPGRRMALVGCILAAMLLSILLGVYLGMQESFAHSVAAAENQRLRQELRRYQAELEETQDSLSLQPGAVVNQHVSEEAQIMINALRHRIAYLEQDVMFYRQVMVPGDEETGLIIAQAEVHAGNTADVYHMKVVFRQQGQQDKALEGQTEVMLVGEKDGKPARHSLQELATNLAEEGLALNFRYFQNLETEITLPAGFIPQTIEIKAESSAPSEKAVEKVFSWLPVEGQ